MMLDRKRSPSRLYHSMPHESSSASPKKAFTPSTLQVYTTARHPEIREVQLLSQESREENHTHRFNIKGHSLILRRGNTLILQIVTSAELSCHYRVSLTFVPVLRPHERFGQFQARGIARGTRELWLSIATPPNFPVGKYHAHIALSMKGGVDVLTHFHHKPIVVLFNPWNPDDDSYLESGVDRAQYVLDDVGTIWRGTAGQPQPMKWEYGQYEEDCLEVALYLLRDLNANECRSAAAVARSVIAHVNPRDASGVLAGCFSGNYGAGVHPCKWNGSTSILQRFHKSKTSTRYGQCWVFAGVSVTLLRALGIPCRPVTCYDSAHFCTKPQQVDRCFSIEGELLQDATNDQIWVYHVWCEAWMRRDDLPPGYDGWQVLDATSQDRQCGRFRIGPASVRAICEGKSGKEWRYDCDYIISEVSSDTRYLRVSPSYSNIANRTLSVAQVKKNETGTRIVTGDRAIDIITCYHDNTEHESPTADVKSRFPPPMRDCSFELVTSEGVRLGEDVEVRVLIHNQGVMLRTVDGRVVGKAVLYTGRVVRNLLSMQFSGVVSPRQSASVTLPIEARKYMKVLSEQGILQLFVAVKVRESKQLFLKVHHFQVCPPPLEIECPSTVPRGSVMRVKLRFKNVLYSSLSRVVFIVQAQTLCPQRELSHKRLVLPGGVVEVVLPLRPQTVGRYTLLASMHCDQITDVRGWAVVHVTS